MLRKISITLSFLFCLKLQALTVAFVDTPLCPQDLKKNIVTHEAQVKIPKACQNIKKFDRSIHAHFVLETFLSSLKIQEQILIHHFNVFNERGEQDPALWAQTLLELKKLNPDFLFMALGFPGDLKDFPKQLGTISFVACGAEGFGITQSTKLWPQENDDPLMTLVGHFTPSLYKHQGPNGGRSEGHIDSDQLYKMKTKFYVTQGGNKKKLRGSSYAVSLAAGLVLTKCAKYVKPKDIVSLNACLQKHSQEFQTPGKQVFYSLTP